MRFLRTHPRPRSHSMRLRYVPLRSQFPALGVCCGSIATEMDCPRYVRFPPDSGRPVDIAECLKPAQQATSRKADVT
jgi:hypothetical protein